MSRTISTSGSPADLDGKVVDAVESLSQRIRSAFRFRLGEWFLAPNKGLDYDLLFSHNTSAGQAAQVLIGVVRDEGGDEITAIRDVAYGLDGGSRRFHFACVVDTIYGSSINVNEELTNA